MDRSNCWATELLPAAGAGEIDHVEEAQPLAFSLCLAVVQRRTTAYGSFSLAKKLALRMTFSAGASTTRPSRLFTKQALSVRPCR